MRENFHQVTGILSSCGTQILSAEFHPICEGLILNRFYVQDLDYSDEPPPERFDEISGRLVEAITDPQEIVPSFRTVWSTEPVQVAADHNPLPTRVHFDNNTSKRYTILSIFAYDKIGLLYGIAKCLSDLGVQVHVAKIGTYLDQVVDVFYVTDPSGQKIVAESQQQTIRLQLLDAVAMVPVGSG